MLPKADLAHLLQEGRPVAYSFCVMTQTEQNYAQIENELLAIVYGCEKSKQYIFARSDVIVQSDHKPLETIFMKPIHTSPKRLHAYLENELVSQTLKCDVGSTREQLFAFELVRAD